MDCGCKQAAPVQAMCPSPLAVVRPVCLASSTCAFSAPRVYRRRASCRSVRPRSGSPSEGGNRPPRRPGLPSGLKVSGQTATVERGPRVWQTVGWLETALATGLMLIAGDARGEEAAADSGGAGEDAGSVVEAGGGSEQEGDSGSAGVDSGNAVEAGSESAQDVVEVVQDVDSGSAIVDSGSAVVDSGNAVEAASGPAQDVFETVQDVGSDAPLVGAESTAEVGSGPAQYTFEIIQGGQSGSGAVDSGSAVEAASGSAQVIQDVDTGDLFGSLATSTISLLFVLAAVGLVVVTIGVVYLSIADYREKKDAEKDRESRSPVNVQTDDAGTSVTGRGKGFGKKPEKVSKEKTRK